MRSVKLSPPLPPLSLALAAMALTAAVAAAQVRPSTIDVDEIRPGMTGYGLTVFRGVTPERFPIEVIDVLHNFRPNQDMILIRTPHPVLNHARAVAGMSGSPIYIDGRLAGAYAYGWPFGLDPMAGVTPIANMLAEMARPVRSDAFPGALPLRPRSAPPRAEAPSRRGARPNAASLAGLPPFSLGAQPSGAFDALRDHARRLGLGTLSEGARPVSTPLMLGGFTDEAARLLADELTPLGLLPLQGGGAGSASAAEMPDHFVDGGTIAVQLVRGDMNMAGIGTVTHVGSDGRLVAFGHPMMGAGQLGFPTATARILHVLASRMRSFKIAEAGPPLGALIHDRQSAIVVDARLQAATIPLRVRIHGAPGAPKTEWNVEIVSHRLMTPAVTLAVLMNALKATAADRTEMSYRVESRVGVDGHGTIELTDRGVMSAGPLDAATLPRLKTFGLINAVYGNPYERARVTSIEMDVHLDPGREFLTIVGASIPQQEVDPGSTLNVRLLLRAQDGRDVVRRVPLDIPAGAGGEAITLMLQPGDAVQRIRPITADLDDLISTIESGYLATSLILSMRRPPRGLRFRGHVVDRLPGSALDAMQMMNDTGADLPFETRARVEVPLGQVLLGRAQLQFQVRDRARGR